jgi:hypothetical protein
MSTEENKALVQRFFDEVCIARKLDVADELRAGENLGRWAWYAGFVASTDTCRTSMKGKEEITWRFL